MTPRFGRSGGSTTPPEPQHTVDLLDYAEALPNVPRRNLTEVARRLARSGRLLAVHYDHSSSRLAFFSVPERLVPAEPTLFPVFERAGRGPVVKGAVRLPNGDRWSGRLEGAGEGNQAALLTVERKSRRRALAPSDAALVVPPDEADVLLALLNGLVALARREGILPRQTDTSLVRRPRK
jgi:hypothetical protein